MRQLNLSRIKHQALTWSKGRAARHVAAAFTLALICALIIHLTTIFWVPRHANWQVWQFLSGNGELVNAWYHSPRQTPENAGDIKAAPEVGYSTCAIDLSDGPVQLRVNAWSPYTSLALYDATGFNFFVVNDTQMPDGYTELVLSTGAADGGPIRHVRSPTRRVVAMTRRLVPDEDGWSRLEGVQNGDVCSRISLEDTAS